MTRLAESLPPTGRAIALLVSSTPSIQDAQPGVLHQLLEFAHRYTTQVISDASVYAEHAGHSGRVDIKDVVLAVQARVGWEFGGRVPNEYIRSLASEVNSTPLPPVPEVFGVRIPPNSECLTSIDFDLVIKKPPPGIKLYDEEMEEIEESESESDDDEEDEDEEMEPAFPPPTHPSQPASTYMPTIVREEAPFPISAIATPSEIDMIATPLGGIGVDEASDVGEEDGLFAGDDEEESDGMEEVQTTKLINGMKRKLVEEEDYD